jgi:aspartate racemase
VLARFTDAARSYFVAVIDRMGREEGCDAAVLGCTEIPLLIAENDSPLPVLDSTRLLARAALRKAYGKG